jgi:hypothetical protein
MYLLFHDRSDKVPQIYPIFHENVLYEIDVLKKISYIS